MEAIYTEYVHEYTDSTGVTRFAVAKKLDDSSYTTPASSSHIKTTGEKVITVRNLALLGGFLTKRQALRRARYLFGVHDGKNLPTAL